MNLLPFLSGFDKIIPHFNRKVARLLVVFNFLEAGTAVTDRLYHIAKKCKSWYYCMSKGNQAAVS
jgi:hypothetical protein